MLNARLNACLEKNSLIPCSQIGFRKNYRTGDRIVTLKILINKYVHKKSKHAKDFLYVCFVDLSSITWESKTNLYLIILYHLELRDYKTVKILLIRKCF